MIANLVPVTAEPTALVDVDVVVPVAGDLVEPQISAALEAAVDAAAQASGLLPGELPLAGPLLA